MTATTKTSTHANGWNAVVKALNNGDDISGLSAKIIDTQNKYSPSHGLHHYAQGAQDCIDEYDRTGTIPKSE